MTWQPSPTALRDAFLHAEECAPRESCGLVVSGSYVPLANVADGHDQFVIGPRDFITWSGQGTVEAVVHSHVDLLPIASEWDVDSCARSGVPWLILSVPEKDFVVIEPPGLRAPLVGREFKWGTQDCFGLVRDAYFDFAGLVLPDMPREWEWWKRGQNLIADNYRDWGFVALDEGERMQHLDVVGIKHRSDVINHLAVLIEPGPRILHHMVGKLSTRHDYVGYWRDSTAAVYRHKRFMRAPPVASVLSPHSDAAAGVSNVVSVEGTGGTAT